MGVRISKDRFAAMVREVVESLPEPFASHVEEVPIEIRSEPTRRQLEEVGLRPDELLLGLYQGRPRTERSVQDSGAMPDVILIFKDHVEAVCDTEEDVYDEVYTTVLHEIGHHFGLDEDQLDALGYG